MFVAIAEIPTQLATIPNCPAFLYNGSGFGHIALEVDDVYKATEAIRRRGGKILRETGPMNAGTTIIAFVTDPDNYQIKIIGKM
jgi:lactoylglutathione lyase